MAEGTAGAPRQLGLLLSLWWRHMRRRATRMGEAPKLSGAPTFLLINLLSLAYLVPLVWRTVTLGMGSDEGFFAWHQLAALSIAFGAGLSKGAATLQLRGMRNDAFLEPLPLTPSARLGLQLADGFFVLPLAFVVPLAATAAHGTFGWASVLPALLGLLAYVASFVLAQALVSWARALGPAATARRCAYLGIGVNLLGLVGLMLPLGQLLEDSGWFAVVLTQLWLDGGTGVYALYAVAVLVLLGAYRAYLAAERIGFDRVVLSGSAPRVRSGVQSRIALEWQMMLRQGGRASLVANCIIGAFTLWLVYYSVRQGFVSRRPLLTSIGAFVVYLGAIQTIAHAGRAARNDLLARPFLSALPLSPHQVLEGKALALRKLLIPVFAMLAVIAVAAVFRGDPSLVYRMALAVAAMYVAVDAAISVGFMSQGVGVVGIGGGQASSSFSTQLLMMPLMATVLAIDNWAASVSCLAVVAVTWESRRAARLGVRWLDDPDDELERETTVWRALLAATAFFTLQAISALVLNLFDVPKGYLLAVAFGLSAAVLALLTFRNGARFERPRFLPRQLSAWPLGPIGGAASGLLALQMAKLIPKAAEITEDAFTPGETIALFVTLVVSAPLAEEYFFRGWLQQAIAKDLPAGKKRWAVALGALVFALAHVGSYGVPQFILGLIAGALYAWGGGLFPAMLAHAVHNGVVLLVGAN